MLMLSATIKFTTPLDERIRGIMGGVTSRIRMGDGFQHLLRAVAVPLAAFEELWNQATIFRSPQSTVMAAMRRLSPEAVRSCHISLLGTMPAEAAKAAVATGNNLASRYCYCYVGERQRNQGRA